CHSGAGRAQPDPLWLRSRARFRSTISTATSLPERQSTASARSPHAPYFGRPQFLTSGHIGQRGYVHNLRNPGTNFTTAGLSSFLCLTRMHVKIYTMVSGQQRSIG
ncbi:unnamed protein product, partial [Ectocarpus sp. 13 AM-2016]